MTNTETTATSTATKPAKRISMTAEKFQTLINDRENYAAEAMRWSIFSNDVARGKTVSIVRRGAHTLQVVRANGPEGGILCYRFEPDGQESFQTIHNWEQWYQWAARIDPYCDENIAIRDAAFAMDTIVRKIQNQVS